MLTPILTVKTATPSAHVTTPEAVLPKEKATAATATLSGRQSEVALRILETINKQLLGSDMPPKDALVRLLDTLARLLKLPQLPQESLLALSKRIAAAIEALPPAARLALEKQLGQRNLLLSARILAELVKPPLPEVAARFDAPLPRPANAPPAQVRPPGRATSRPAAGADTATAATATGGPAAPSRRRPRRWKFRCLCIAGGLAKRLQRGGRCRNRRCRHRRQRRDRRRNRRWS